MVDTGSSIRLLRLLHHLIIVDVVAVVVAGEPRLTLDTAGLGPLIV